MKKIISIFFLVIGVSSLIAGISLIWINKSEENKKLAVLKASIVSDYDNFKKQIEDFSNERIEIYDSLHKISYLTDLSSNYETIIAQYKEYEEILKKIEENNKGLKSNCLENSFKENEITSKVNAFIINYEQAVNYFIKDVATFNEEVDRYNEWVENTQVMGDYKKIEGYESSYKDYIDINGDGIYNGADM